MLRPQDNGIRETKRLDGIWDFVVDVDGTGRSQEWWRRSLPGARAISVPSSFNDLFVDRAVHDHVGDVWYQLEAYVPHGWGGERILLRFDAVAHHASVWVDDTLVAEHSGGYLPFEAEVSDFVRPGEGVRITVAVNNELTFQTIPPGIVQEQPDGTRRQHYYHDFFNYAGLHRSVWLHTTPEQHVSDVTVTTDIDGSTGIVGYDVDIDGGVEHELTVTVRMLDASGSEVGSTNGSAGEVRIANAQLWAPGNGYLHELVVELTDADGTAVDRFLQPVGIRTVAIDGTRFLINGEPFHFTGFGMHEDHLVRGKGHDDASMIHDFALLDWLGANSFRTSHYPYAEEVLDHADRNGIVVIDESAAVGLNLSVGGGFFLGGPKQTFSDETINDETQQALRQHLLALIDRDKNHPSVVLWSIANEPESNTDDSVAFFEPLFAATREADPTRPVGFVNMMLAPAGACRLAEFADVIMLNRYYGWYIGPGDLDTAEQGLEQELRQWAEDGKPIIMTEYGADTVPGLHKVDGGPFTEEYQTALIEMYHRVFDRIDAVVGEQIWNFADFETTSSFMRVDGNKKGVFTRARDPKAVVQHLRARWGGCDVAAEA